MPSSRPFSWQDAFSEVHDFTWKNPTEFEGMLQVNSLPKLKRFLDWTHIKFALLQPYFEQDDYPLVDSRALLPSFELDLYEHKELPGFICVCLARPIDYFREIFQFDRLHNVMDIPGHADGDSCPLEHNVHDQNIQTMRSRLPRMDQDAFVEDFEGSDITYLESYPNLLKYLLFMERAHVISQDAIGEFYLSGVYGSLPSDLDAEIKRFGLKIGKFKPGDNELYERNRLFVYQYLMELYGFPIVSERRTATSMFSRRLHRMGETFLVRVLGQSDRTLTTLYTCPRTRTHPCVEKVALVQVEPDQQELLQTLEEGEFFVDEERRVVILRVIYRQHKYNPHNVRQDRAISVLRQEIIHPVTGELLTDINVIKDTTNMILRLTDIVRGEYNGTITYKRQEVVHNTDTHDKRLKFLHFWLTKHQRRIIGYSDEFYAGVVRVLDSYLLSPDNFETFNSIYDLYQEVWAKYSYIQQARKVKMIEDLKDREYKGERIDYLQMFTILNETLQELKFEIVNYFGPLVDTAIAIGEEVLGDSYISRRYLSQKDDELTKYGAKVRKQYRRLVQLVDEFRAIRKART